MKKEIQNRIVHIALPKGKEKKHKHFSGYILGDGIIITCRHGFADQDAYDQQRPIQIISQENKYTIDFNSFDIKGLLDEGIILFESATYDIVLLRCEQASAKFEGLLTNKLEESGKWTGGGYPYYSRANSDTDGLELFSGEFEIVVSAGNYLQLYVNTKLPCMNDWHEISGSPVFIREKLAGIICRYFEYDSKGKKVIIPHRLTAVYLQRLWEADKQFQTLLNKIDSSFDKSAKILQQAESLLKSLL
ncbi:MAG: hypothetical protein WBM35_12065, partial [Candidatus Electrothrix sp.]